LKKNGLAKWSYKLKINYLILDEVSNCEPEGRSNQVIFFETVSASITQIKV